MMVGGAVAGFVGDRMGRRFALIGSVLIFGVLTAAVALVDNVWTSPRSASWQALASAAPCPTPRLSRPSTCRVGTGRLPSL